jgi:ABC-type branched-subunit amino acid transport system ATPase component
MAATQATNGSAPTRPAPVFEARGLDAGYGSLAAVRDLNLEVHPGEVVALLGPNGAGKSTTLLTLAGALAPLRGDIVWNGEVVKSSLHQRVRNGLGFVPDERSVFAGLNTDENLRLGLGDKSKALDLFPELGTLLKRRAGLLSGGEQQMLALGRVLAAGPSVLLLDELSLGLAPIAVTRLFKAVKDAAHRGAGVILVEQHISRALEVADQVYVLNHGRLVLQAPCEELRADQARLRSSYLESELVQ